MLESSPQLMLRETLGGRVNQKAMEHFLGHVGTLEWNCTSFSHAQMEILEKGVNDKIVELYELGTQALGCSKIDAKTTGPYFKTT